LRENRASIGIPRKIGTTGYRPNIQEASVGDTRSTSTISLIAIPALISLGVTVLRLVGELQHWPPLWFSPVAGGGGAIIGITWLPIIFGPYFAFKLGKGLDRPSGRVKSIGFAVLVLAVLFLAIAWAQSTFSHPSILTLVAFVAMLAAPLIPGIGWPALAKTLLVYALAARIPVLIVMFLAMRGSGSQGWGTHYDAVSPIFARLPLATKFFYEAFLAQMTLWIGWTVAVGSVFGTVLAALVPRGKQSALAHE
jgi:hypothetical protein